MTTPPEPDPDATDLAARNALLDEALGLAHSDAGWSLASGRPAAMDDLAALDARPPARPPQGDEHVDGGGA